MSLKAEQYNSLVKTQKFLRDLLYKDTRPKKVSELKERAYRCLRHFPHLKENGEPMFSMDDFPCPKIQFIEEYGINK
jgi:hypothetical protein